MEGGGARGKKPPLHIVSWNVAAWAKTMQFIKSRHQSLRHYLRAHKIDILCLQETKITAAKLANDPKIAGITPDLGYDSFWCWSSDEFKGFNGVATFARRGLTASASNKLCGDKDVNDEGRAIVTKHDGFAIINVYVPNSSGTSERLLFKMRFLHAVQRRMEDLEKEGLEVILCGDLNLTYRPEDVKWSWRSLQIDEFLDMQFPAPAPVESSSNSSKINGIVDSGESGVASKQEGGAANEPWDPVAAVKKFLPMLASLHCSHCGCNGCVCPRCRRVRPIETQCQFCLCVTAAMRHGQPDDSTTCISEQDGLEAPAHRDNRDNAARAELYMAFYLQVLQDCRKIQAIMKEKWPAVCAALEQKTIEEQEVSLRRTSTQVKYRVAVVGVNGKVRLGKPYMQRARAERAYDFASAWTVTDDVTGNNYIAWRQNTVAVYDIAELLEKVCGVKLSLREQRSLCLLGHQVHALCAGEWLKSVLARDYVDTFVEFYPAAQGRFTCHDQYKNRRYENEGSRIDYFVISRRLFQRVVEGTQQQQQQQYPPLVTAKNDIRPNEKASERHSTSAPCGLITSPACSNPFCEMCALSAVTHNGRWKPAPFDGSGITTGTKADYDAHITYPRNGIIYTPPQYSDHIAVSIVLGHPDRQPLSLDDTKDTKQTQPHLKIKRINSFFKQTSRKVEQALHETDAGSSEKGNEKTQEAMDKAGRPSRNEELLRGREGERERKEQRNVVVDGGGDDDDDDDDDDDGKKERREERPVGADKKPREESEDAGKGQEGVFVDDPASSRQNRDQGPPSNPYKRKSQTLAAFVQRGAKLVGGGNRPVRDGWEPADGEHSSAQHMQQPEEEQPQQEVSSAQRQKPPAQNHGSVERAEPKDQKLFGGALFSTFSTVVSSSPPLASQTPSPPSSTLTSPSRASRNSAAPTFVSEKQAAAQDKEGEEGEEVVASFPVTAPIIISESPLQQARAMQARSHSGNKGMQPVNLLAQDEVMSEGVIEQFQFSRSGSGKRGPLPSVPALQTVRCARAGSGMSTKKAKVGGKGKKNFSVRAPPRKKKGKKKPAPDKNTSSARKKPSLSPANPSASASIKGFFKQ